MKKVLVTLLVAIAIAFFLVVATIVKYNSMLSEKSLYAISGTQENYSWAVAKFSIQLSEFYALVKTDRGNIDKIRDKLDILYSRVGVIREKSESTAPLYLQNGYKETVDSIYNKLESVDKYINQPHPDLNKVIELVNQIEPDSKELSNLADHAEVAQRTKAKEDYVENRKQIFFLLMTAMLLVSSLCIITPIYLFKLYRLWNAERKAFNNKNAFLGVVGHELRTSLQAIISSIDVIISKAEFSSNKQHFDRLENAAIKMERQMKDITDFAKIDNGNIEVNKSSLNLNRLIKTSIDDSVDLLPKQSVSVLAKEIPDVFIFSDSSRLMQIMENLITNAIKYTEKGTVIITAAIEDGKNLTIEVKDSGQGIPKDKIPTIFKPFIRISNSKDFIPGFGMGLAIVYGIVKALKGSISVKSEVGKGSVFTVQVPIELAPYADVSSVEDNLVFNAEHTNLNILLVDDNEMSCTSIASLLDSANYKVEYTTSPERAMEKLLRKSYDLVLSDLQMPMITGGELFNKIHSMDGPNKNIPFIFISAYDSESPISNVPMLTKPVRIKDINRQINLVMNKS